MMAVFGAFPGFFRFVTLAFAVFPVVFEGVFEGMVSPFQWASAGRARFKSSIRIGGAALETVATSPAIARSYIFGTREFCIDPACRGILN
jgi:hypothetical protein